MLNKKNLPNNYFEKLPEDILGKISALNDELEENAPLLSKMQTLNPYKVPSGYFEHGAFDFGKIKKPVPVYLLPMRIAASLIFIMLIGWTFVKIDKGTSDPDLAEADVFDYYLDNVDELDDDIFREVYAEAVYGPEEINEEEILLDILLTEFSDTELDLY